MGKNSKKIIKYCNNEQAISEVKNFEIYLGIALNQLSNLKEIFKSHCRDEIECITSTCIEKEPAL